MLSLSLFHPRKIKNVNEYLKIRYAVEIAGGLGPTVGTIIRIGLMGENARSVHVTTALTVLQECLKKIRSLSNL